MPLRKDIVARMEAPSPSERPFEESCAVCEWGLTCPLSCWVTSVTLTLAPFLEGRSKT
jgi:hypothetical protein